MKQAERSTFKLLFYVKRTKVQKSGEIPIYARITINKQRAEFSIGRTIEPGLWDKNKNRLKGHTNLAREVNNYLLTISNKIYNTRRDMLDKGDYVSPKSLSNNFLDKYEQGLTILNLFKEHNVKMKEVVGIKYSKTTPKKYNTCFMHLSNFIKIKRSNIDIPLKFLDLRFINEFDYYLVADAKLQPGSINTMMKALKKIIRMGISDRIILFDPFLGYKSKKVPVKRRFLNPQELKLIENTILDDERLERVRDIFVFTCYTGMSHCDVQGLTKANYQINIGGGKVLVGERQKSNSRYVIPILHKAQKILDKYENWPGNNGKLLPVISNQKMNEYLKEITSTIGLEKNVTCHMGRHTFATTIILSNNVPIESLQAMLAHKDNEQPRGRASRYQKEFVTQTDLFPT